MSVLLICKRAIDGGVLPRRTMKGRLALLLVVNLVLMSCGTVGSATADEQQPAWRSVGIDPTQWTDGPVEEDTPMKNTYQGNAVFEIEVSYIPSLGSSRQSGTITLELFEQWAPITTANMIKNVESGIYDGIFFHRVIDDFVTQSGDPTCKTFGSLSSYQPLNAVAVGRGRPFLWNMKTTFHMLMVQLVWLEVKKKILQTLNGILQKLKHTTLIQKTVMTAVMQPLVLFVTACHMFETSLNRRLLMTQLEMKTSKTQHHPQADQSMKFSLPQSP